MLCDALLPHQGAAENVKHIEELGQLAGDYTLASMAPEQGHGAARRQKRIGRIIQQGWMGIAFCSGGGRLHVDDDDEMSEMTM